MGFFDWLVGARRKESQGRIALAINQVGTPQGTPKNYAAFAAEGYQKNVIVFRCIEEIAGACASIPWKLNRVNASGDTDEVDGPHPLKELMKRPNPMQGQSAFIAAMVSYLSLDGNSYIEAVGPRPGAPPKELWCLPPDRMRVVPGQGGYPAAYEFTGHGPIIYFPVDFVKMKAAILHLKTWHPTNLWYGMSPLESALVQVDQSNAGSQWNLSMLQNQSVPSGVLTVEPSDMNPNGTLTEEQYAALKAQVDERYSGAKNAGRPMLLEAGLSWQAMGLGPKDMDYTNGKNVTSREICIAYGVPPLLLNIAGDNTYANYKEARLAFYQTTIFKIMSFIKTELNRWLTPAFGPGLELDYDKNAVDAIRQAREESMDRVDKHTFLTQNEKRKAAGYDEIDGMDVFLVGQSFYQEGVDPTEASEDPAEETGEYDQDDNPVEPDPDDETEDPDSEEEIQKAFRPELGIKLFNLVNGNEKQKSARKQNALKARFARDLKSDLEDDFAMMEAKLISDLSTMDPRLMDYAALKIVDDYEDEFTKTLRKAYRKSLNATGDMVLESGRKHLKGIEVKATRKQQFKFSQFVEKYINEQSAKAVTEISGTTKKQVREQIRELLAQYEEDPNLDLPAALQKRFKGLSGARAENIARTEMNSATNYGTLDAVKSLEIPNMKKEWVATIDDYTRDDSNVANHVYMNGTFVDINEKFIVPPDAEMDIPGDPTADASQICNCRCVAVYGVRE